MLRYLFTAYAVAVALLLSSSTLRAQDGVADPAPEPAPVASQADPPLTPASGTSTSGTSTDRPHGIEKVRQYVENSSITRRLEEGEGFYPKIGGLSPGSGLAGGGGYRHHLGFTFVDLSAAASTKAYSGVDAKMRWLQTANQSFEVSTNLTFRNNTQDDFYGLGIDSTNATRVDFAIRTTDLTAHLIGRVRPWLRVGADVGYEVPSIRSGRDDNSRSIEEVFTDETAPGLASQPHYLHDGVFAEIDSRDAPGFPTRGGLFRTAYALWNDRTLNQYDFRRFDVQGSQFFALAPKDVIALRLSLTYANNAPGERVPFYLLPYVGGGDTVRAFREFRFRDENAGIFNVEFRHRVHKLAHVAGFVDLGKVAHDWQDINPTHLRPAYGVGVRAGNDKHVFLRFDVAYGDGGTRVFLKFSPAF
jgi:hypothetical protein